MSVYLDQLIKSVEAEIAQERIFEQRKQHHPSKRTLSSLNRMLQRLATLKALRKAERRGTTPARQSGSRERFKERAHEAPPTIRTHAHVQ